MKRALAVIAMVSAAIAAWVWLRTEARSPEQPAGDRQQPPVTARAPATEPPGGSQGAATTPPAPGAPAAAPRALLTAPSGRAAVEPAAPPAAAPPMEDAGASSAALAHEAGAASSAPPAVAASPEQAPVRSGAIAGAVLDAQGAPIPGATILAVAPDATDGTETFTDDDGEFVLPGLRPGRYAVFTGLGTALAPRLGSRGVQVRSTAVTRVELREPKDAARVRVVATDAGGRAVEGQAILVQGLPADGGAFGSVLASDAIFVPEPHDGGSSLRVPPGTYTVVVLQRAGLPARVARETIRVAGAPLDVTVELGDAPASQTGYAPETSLPGDAVALP